VKKSVSLGSSCAIPAQNGIEHHGSYGTHVIRDWIRKNIHNPDRQRYGH
jgi:hypothetical protein